MNPDPSVRGLRYGKPPKNTDAYRYVDRVPRRRADRFIWIAVIAALLAVAAIAGIVLNAILPGNDFHFGKSESGDDVASLGRY